MTEIDESDSADLAGDVRTIRYEIESIKRTQQLILRKDAEQLIALVIPLFEDKSNALMASVYLYVDGTRSQAEIVQAMAGDGIPISQPTVSRRMMTLAEEGLIEQVDVKGRGVVWAKNPEIEKSLRLGTELQRRRIR
jgi:DNA-binding transcriptional ArsR family regulator